MDELEISGKRYISSRRAAKEHHYHSDYIGQLVRSKKVLGTKVGRAWYVDEGSLNAYFAIESHTAPIQIKNTQAIEKEIAQQVRHILPISKYETMDENDEGKNNFTIRKQTATLQYIPHDEPLFPALQKRHVTATARTLYAPVVQHSRQVSRTKKTPLWVAFALFILLGGAIFGATAFLSAKLISTVTVEQGKAARVGISFR